MSANQPRRRTSGSTTDRPRARRRSGASAPRRSAPPTASTHEFRLHATTPDSATPSPHARSSCTHPSSATAIAQHPHELWLGAAGHADGAIRHARRQRQRLVDVVGTLSGAPHDLVHRDERRVPRQQAIGQPERRDLGDAFLARRGGTEIGQVRDAGSCPEMPKRGVARVGALRRRRQSTSGTRRDRSCPRSRSIRRRGRAIFRRRRSGGWQTGPGSSPARRRRRRIPRTSRRCR